MSQCSKMLQLLAHTCDWVSMKALCEYSGSLNAHSRISELRKRGHNIDCKVEQQPNGVKHSWYRLVPDLRPDTDHTGTARNIGPGLEVRDSDLGGETSKWFHP